MFSLFIIFFLGLYTFIFVFKKKLMALLMLELCFICVIFFYFFFSFNSLGICSIFSMMIFLGFMVMDSVLGLCLLVFSSRNSTFFLDPFFSC